MKKLFIASFLALGIFTANAQSELTFRPFKFDISAGLARYTSDITYGSPNGFLLAFEPKYAISDEISLGIKIETAISISTDDEIKASGCYIATADYYLGTNTVRPFAGIGIGIYTHASTQVGSNDNVKGYTRFGGMPRIGVEIAHFRAAIEYNVAGKVSNINKNYLGIKLGVLIGGGRIDQY